MLDWAMSMAAMSSDLSAGQASILRIRIVVWLLAALRRLRAGLGENAMNGMGATVTIVV